MQRRAVALDRRFEREVAARRGDGRRVRAGDEETAQRAEEIAGRTFELSKLLIDVLGITDAAEQLGSYFPHEVTFHSSCHGMRLMKLGSRQSDLIKTVEGVQFK